MSEIASIAAGTDATPSRRSAAARNNAPEFSYALAAASLERKAAQSLKAHGAAPNADTASPTRTVTDSVNAPLERSKALVAEGDSKIEPATNSSSSSASFEEGHSSIAIAAPVQIAPGTLQQTPTSGQSAMSPAGKTGDAALIRDAATADRARYAAKALRAPAEPAALKAEFAEILAEQLEKTSVFDLRLDPPDLGRVDGRLALNDDGKAILTLTFDNQNAFDLFSKDEQALREALMQSGFNFEAGDFAFAFKERVPEPPAFDTSEFVREIRGDYDPVFLAPWSAGALDIRI